MKRPSYRNVKAKRPDTKHFLLIRHAESVANTKSILAGRIDPNPLSREGRKIAKELEPVISSFDPHLVLTSPLLRCRQTIEEAGRFDYEIEERLIEMDYGSWSGKSLKALARKKEWATVQKRPESFTFPNGESFSSASNRLQELIKELQTRDAERIVLVTHGDITRILINQMMGRPFADFQEIIVEPASFSQLSHTYLSDGSPSTTIRFLNRLPVPRASQKPRGYKLGGE